MKPATAAQIHHLRRLLAAGVPQAEAARQIGLSRRTVARFGRGHVRKFSVPADPPPGFDIRKLARCPDCGGLNYEHPCLRCRLTRATAGDVSPQS